MTIDTRTCIYEINIIMVYRWCDIGIELYIIDRRTVMKIKCLISKKIETITLVSLGAINAYFDLFLMVYERQLSRIEPIIIRAIKSNYIRMYKRIRKSR